MAVQPWWARLFGASAPVTDPEIPATGGALVAVTDLQKCYREGDQDRVVLDHLSLTIQPGEFVVLLGHSGSGKSTLLNLVSGIDRPSAGSVTINGVAITALDERSRTLFRRDHIGFIFQFFNLIPTLSVLENVTLPYELAGQPLAQVQGLGTELLTAVGLGDRLDTSPDKLSGGQQQRVAIARALVHNPCLILADEPTGNLDETTGQQVLDLLLSLTRDSGKTLIMATHNPDIARHADRVLRVQDGQMTPVVMSAAQAAIAPLQPGVA